jgi:hypothetical protein
LGVVFELIGELRRTCRFLTCTPCARRPIQPPCTPEEGGEEDEGRRVLSEVLEEDAP